MDVGDRVGEQGMIRAMRLFPVGNEKLLCLLAALMIWQ